MSKPPQKVPLKTENMKTFVKEDVLLDYTAAVLCQVSWIKWNKKVKCAHACAFEWGACVWASTSSVHDKLVQFQACCEGVLIFVSRCCSCPPPSSTTFLFRSPSDLNRRGSAVRSPSDSAEIITVQPSSYISPVIRRLRGVVDQVRSRNPAPSTTATAAFGDMINKSQRLCYNNSVICFLRPLSSPHFISGPKESERERAGADTS